MLPWYRALVVLPFLSCVALQAFQSRPHSSGPRLLDMAELKALAEPDPPPAALGKLDQLLQTPFVSNQGRGNSTQLVPSAAGLRVAFWNIERGQRLPLIRAALSDPARFRAMVEARQPVKDREWRKVEAELAALRRADVIILNEVDLGMKRSGYADVARELAEAIGMNYAFGVEFVELDRLYTGEERIELETPERTQALADDLRVDPVRYRGLHGNAVLTRFPIRAARVQRLSECYDWYGEEIDGIAALERGKRLAAQTVFEERIRRQVRRGGRMALLVELEVPGAPGGLTVVSTHLEDRTTAACRREQMAAVMARVRDVTAPVVIGGDLNTSGSDGTPTSIGYEIRKRVSNPRFWVKQGIRWFSPVAIPSLLTVPFNFWKNYRDPTAIHIPLVAPNRSRRMFSELREFRFADGGRLDLSGGSRRSGNGRGRTLANSNQRAWKGFHPTFRLERTFGGLVGVYRLDWLLVKAVPQAGGRADLFRPRDPKTLRRFNELGDERVSDHDAITVDLELPPGTVAANAPDSEPQQP